MTSLGNLMYANARYYKVYAVSLPKLGIFHIETPCPQWVFFVILYVFWLYFVVLAMLFLPVYPLKSITKSGCSYDLKV